MSRATLSQIQAEVYSFLNVDGGTYGTYVSNARYPTDAINDAIYDADNFIGMLLAKGGQDSLMFSAALSKDISSTGTIIPNANSESFHIVSVEDSDTGRHLKLVPYLQYELLFGSTPKIASYFGIYAVNNNQIFFLTSGIGITVRYFDFDKSTTIKCPDGFEPAIAYRAASILLMKRADNPEAAAFYDGKWKEFMAAFVSVEDATK